MKPAFRAPGQRGFTIVEIMVALAISLILIAGVIQVFLGSKQSYAINESLARVQENMRFAMHLIGGEVRKAGYKSSVVEDEFAFPLDAPFAAGQVIVGTDDNANPGDNILDGSDTVTLRYEGNDDGLLRDCLGATVDTDVITTVVLRVNTANELECEVTAPVAAVGTQSLLSAVGGLQFEYGEDSNGNGSVNQYSSAGGVTSWLDVVSVRVTINFLTSNSELDSRSSTSVLALRNKLQ